jgi:hypothetical protein
MSYNGSGTFVINSTGQPVVTGTIISSTAFNALTADLATGLTTAMTKDGQTTATGNIPMGSFKFTGLGAGSAASDSANIGQVQNSFGSFLTVAGTDTITASVSPALTAYTAGQMFAFVAANTNTGAVTINISSLGAKSITKNGTTALVASDLTANYLFVIVYDGTQFQLVGVSSTTFANLTVTGVLTLSGAGTQLLSTGTGAWQPPIGTTGQRPATPGNGSFRWNSTLNALEVYNGINWIVVVSQSYTASYLAVAGGGGGGGSYGGGGGGGGLLTASTSFSSGTAYTITIGAGGAAVTTAALGNNGTNTVITGIANATAGGGGGSSSVSSGAAASGGSGGGGALNSVGAAGTSGQGNAGGSADSTGTYATGGGGGGAGAVGVNGNTSVGGGNGGAGTSNALSGAAVTYAGGGGGGTSNTTSGGTGGAGGGGNGGVLNSAGTAATVNTGSGGGGGGGNTPTSGAGGSGIVIISYVGAQRGTGGTVTTSSGNTIHTFTTSGTYTA